MTNVLRWTVDVLAVLLVTALAAAATLQGLGGWVRAFIVVPLVVIVPGYVVMATLFPGASERNAGGLDAGEGGLKDPRLKKEGVDGIERLVFSVLASIVIVPLVAVAAHFSPWGVTLWPILAGVVGVTVVFSGLAIARRARLHPDDRYHPPMLAPVRGLAFGGSPATLGRRRDRSHVFNVVLVLSILLFASSVGYAAVNPPRGDGFTELSIDTPSVIYDRHALYPEQFGADESRALPVVLSNHEGERVEYDLVVLVQRVDGQGENATVVEETEVGRRTVAIGDGKEVEIPFEVTPSMSGDDLRLAVLAYGGDAPAEPTVDDADQSLRLPIEVASADGGDGSSTAGNGGGTESPSAVAPVPTIAITPAPTGGPAAGGAAPGPSVAPLGA